MTEEHKNLRGIANALWDLSHALNELTDAVTVVLVFIDAAAQQRKLAPAFLEAVDKMRDALDEVAP